MYVDNLDGHAAIDQRSSARKFCTEWPCRRILVTHSDTPRHCSIDLSRNPSERHIVAHGYQDLPCCSVRLSITLQHCAEKMSAVELSAQAQGDAAVDTDGSESQPAFGEGADVEDHLLGFSTASSLVLCSLSPFGRFGFSWRRRLFIWSLTFIALLMLILFLVGSVGSFQGRTVTEVDFEEADTLKWPSIAVCLEGNIAALTQHLGQPSMTINIVTTGPSPAYPGFTNMLTFTDASVASLPCYMFPDVPEEYYATQNIDSLSIYVPCVAGCPSNIFVVVAANVSLPQNVVELDNVMLSANKTYILSYSLAVLVRQPDSYFRGPFEQVETEIFTIERVYPFGDISAALTLSFNPQRLIVQSTTFRTKNAADVLSAVGGLIGLVDFCLSFLLLALSVMVYRRLVRKEQRMKTAAEDSSARSSSVQMSEFRGSSDAMLHPKS
jgi:hypothetical protein